MTIEEAQKKVDGWIRKYGVRYFSELTNMAELTEEVGEVAWMPFQTARQVARSAPHLLSPWSVLQLNQLEDDPWSAP